jgi:hypothetical protein
VVEILLVGRPQACGRDQRDARLFERLRQTRARRGVNRVAPERVTFQEEPDMEAQVVICGHLFYNIAEEFRFSRIEVKSRVNFTRFQRHSKSPPENRS